MVGATKTQTHWRLKSSFQLTSVCLGHFTQPLHGFCSEEACGFGMMGSGLSVPKRCLPKTLAFAFGLRLRSKMRCFKTRVLGRRLPNGRPPERLRFRALRSKTLAFKKRIAIIFCDLKTSLGARACV